jgi:hypothetical protein
MAKQTNAIQILTNILNKLKNDSKEGVYNLYAYIKSNTTTEEFDVVRHYLAPRHAQYQTTDYTITELQNVTDYLRSNKPEASTVTIHLFNGIKVIINKTEEEYNNYVQDNLFDKFVKFTNVTLSSSTNKMYNKTITINSDYIVCEIIGSSPL